MSELSHELLNHDIKAKNDVNASFNNFQSIVLEVTDKYAPLRTYRQNANKLPSWFSKRLKNLRFKRRQLHRVWHVDKNNSLKRSAFSSIRKKFQREYNRAKKDYYAEKFRMCIGDSRQTYKLLKDISGRNSGLASLPVLSSCVTDANPKPSAFDVATKFNQYFTNIGAKSASNIGNCDPTLPCELPFSMYMYPCDVNEVLGILTSLDT